MRLKSVRLFGFKTFADRTEFSLDGPIIAVVGPNGCGKSNLVDAILWGLGEGNARHLRAQSGADVIFNGSARRKGVGFSEVTLLFDNEDGGLPVESPEVAITRRITRNGDNEYSINRRGCRQRDVYELLADSGLGRAGYAIVGQKEIDAALNASAEDRRGWIDEAAGVQRYRQRKTESQRRLSSAQEHLERVTDILIELDAQREPLRQEAEVAARYRLVQSTLQEIEVGYLAWEAATAAAEQERLEASIAQSMRLTASEAERAEALEAAAAEAAAKAKQLEALADGHRVRSQELTTTIERGEADVRLSQQKLEGLDEQGKTLLLDREETGARIEEARQEVQRLELDLANLEEEATEMRAAGAEEIQERSELSAQLKALEAELAAAKEHEARRNRLIVEREHRQERLGLAKRELSGLLKGLPDLESAAAEADAAAAEAAAAVEALQEEVRTLAEQEQALRAEEDRDAREVRSALAERAALEGRRRGIEATIEAHEGLAQGTRAVLDAVKARHLNGSYVPVSEAVETRKELAMAVETALGGASNDLIVEREADAKAAIEWLKKNRAGRATFQPIPLMRPQRESPDLQRLCSQAGVIGVASELVTCDREHWPVIDSLLGRILIVETLDHALKLAKTTGWSRLVTLDGELVHSSGAVTGGAQARQGYGIVQRRADLAEIAKELKRMEKTVSGFEQRSAKRAAEQSALAQRTSELLPKRRAQETDLSEARSYARTLEDELKGALREREKLEKDIATGLPEAPPDPVDATQISERRDFVVRSLAEIDAVASQKEHRLSEVAERLQKAKELAGAGKRRLEAATQADASREKRAEAIGPERLRITRQMAELGGQIQSKRKERLLADSDFQRVQTERRELLESAEKSTAEARRAREDLAALGAAMHQAELNRTRADAKRSAALSRLAEEYGITVEELADRPEPAPPPPDAPALVQRLRRELRAMGDVNLGAVEAYERLSGRFEELTAQKEDVEGGMVEIMRSIHELDKLTRDKFSTTFNAVGEAFGRMFFKMFGGGEGAIRLTDPEDMLNSGIEIEVTLPGKRKQALNLLSGGERSLCTVAFLFALLDVKPSPLVVLDEVDAPLDGRNVERFAEALREFTDKTQFIVITHNAVTIASADLWIGVTMQEPGVSTLLPARVTARDPLTEKELAALN